MTSVNQHSFIGNRNWPTNSLPYGYGGLTAETIVFAVRIIMFPTSSRTFLVGRKVRSVTARIKFSPFLPGYLRPQSRDRTETKPTTRIPEQPTWNRHRNRREDRTGHGMFGW